MSASNYSLTKSTSSYYSQKRELIALYGLNRHANVRLLRRLKSVDLLKSARHPELDHRVTVADYVAMMSKHGPNHRGQIERLKKNRFGNRIKRPDDHQATVRNGVADASVSLQEASFSPSPSGHRTLVDRLRPCARCGERA